MQTSNDLTAFLKNKRITVVAPTSSHEVIGGHRLEGITYANCHRAVYPADGAYMAWLAAELGAMVRFITAPVRDAFAEEVHRLLRVKGVELHVEGELHMEASWRCTLIDSKSGDLVHCSGETPGAWHVPDTELPEKSSAIIIYADEEGMNAPMVQEAFKYASCVILLDRSDVNAPGVVMLLQQLDDAVAVKTSYKIEGDCVVVEGSGDSDIGVNAWPEAARFAAAEVMALAAALALLAKNVFTVDALAQQLSRLQPPSFEKKGGSRAAPQAAGKLLPFALLKEEIQREKAAGKRIVWTNGCFDIVHAGHVTYLERAAALGDILVVGLNSDASVRLGKGPNRPIVPEDQRAKLLAALRCVDYLVIYDEPSPVELIRQLAPDIYAKGGDYNIDTINQPERRLMESLGGRIELLPGVPGISTSVIIENVLKAYAGQPEE